MRSRSTLDRSSAAGIVVTDGHLPSGRRAAADVVGVEGLNLGARVVRAEDSGQPLAGDLLALDGNVGRQLRSAAAEAVPDGMPYGVVDLRSGRSLSLLEDLVASKGASFCTPQTSISREQIEDLLGNMAVWHGR